MNDQELDEAYGELCRMLGDAGEAQALSTLARFALLTMHEIGDAAKIRQLLREAAPLG